MPTPCGQLLCQHDSYLRNCETRVLSVEAVAAEGKKKKNKNKVSLTRVVLEDSVFFPEGGGQHSDTGTITIKLDADGSLQTYQVADVQNEAGCAGCREPGTTQTL